MRTPASFALALLVLACATAPVRHSGLQQRLDDTPEGGLLLIEAGEWTGNLVVRKPMTLRGASAAGTILSGQVTVASRGVLIETLGLTSGGFGIRLEAGAIASFRHVHIAASGPGLVADAGSVGTFEDSSFQCSAPGQTGTAIEARGVLSLGRVEVAPGCRKGVSLDHAVAELHRMTIRGALEAGVHALDSRLTITDLDVDSTGVKGAGVFAARSLLEAVNLTMSGGEEGLLLRDSTLHLEGLRARQISMTALALVGGTADVKSGWLVGPFREGALSALDGSALAVSDVDVQSAGATGLFAVGAKVNVRSMRVSGAREDADGDYGHGFTFTRSQGTLSNIGVTDAAGAAVYVSNQVSTVQINGCRARMVGAGVVASIHARVNVTELDVSEASVGLLAMRGAEIQARDGNIQSDTGIAACGESSVNETGKLQVKSARPRSTCDEADRGIPWHRMLREPPELRRPQE